MRRLLTGIGASVAAAVALAGVAPPAAHADELSYIQYLDDNGLRPMLRPDGALIQEGFNVCSSFRAGNTRDEIIQQYAISLNPNIPALVDAAHQHLCPDA